MMRKIKNNNLILAVFVALLALGAFAFMFFNTQKVYSEIIDASEEASTLQSNRFRKDTVFELMNRTEVERGLVESYFVDANGVVDFIERVEALGFVIGATVEVESVKTSPIEAEERLEKLEIVASVAGTWEQNLSFIAKLENLPFKTEIHNMLIEKRGDEEVTWRSEYVVSVLKIK